MNYSFQIIIFILLIVNILINLYIYKEIIINFTRKEEPAYVQKQVEFKENKTKNKEESEEDKIIKGLNNLLVYDGSPTSKKE
jgi:flagellar biosynthesis/type III secretory pathway M-ring protein FliF/YscJ